ncbi:hypothetical protein [Deinococcus soli (ex Cha et al. 2016)]|uniref:Uncharacterized protein n=1 Tax=Deinococcus soli (ex Cha et al. 2016) TaxID=1309411 RepID=A0ACC6KPM7_9DEIO|nr:hypothetical protein [Deinococcus soli (ex Cha et al. 2016)]MDR6330585.1 hypothetical protein [Deinococcus soli (ex Cha et al. 2016)]MDR6754362.1 hypothetical protein [Deinococcus soli (ex Cha et al. 2016)]
MNGFRVKYPDLPELPPTPAPTNEQRNVTAAELSAQATQQATQVAERSLFVTKVGAGISGGLGLAALWIACATAKYARQALSTWKSQMFGEHQYASAMTALKALQSIRVLIQNRRSSLGSSLQVPLPAKIRRQADLRQQLMDNFQDRVDKGRNLVGQQKHHEFALALNAQRDVLEQALVGLEPQWGTEFTNLVQAATKRMEEFASASQIKEYLVAPDNRSYLLEVQKNRTVESEQKDRLHKALYWMGVPRILVPSGGLQVVVTDGPDSLVAGARPEAPADTTGLKAPGEGITVPGP